MNKLMIAFAATMALMSFGCKRKDAGGDSGAALAKMAEFKDQMCACKDAECAKKVSDEMTKWSQEQAKDNKGQAAMSEADQKKATEIGTEMGECMQKAMGLGGAAAPAEGEAAPTEGSADPAAAGEGSAEASGEAAPAEGEGDKPEEGEKKEE